MLNAKFEAAIFVAANVAIRSFGRNDRMTPIVLTHSPTDDVFSTLLLLIDTYIPISSLNSERFAEYTCSHSA